jgi:hypothetical protein
VPDDEPLTAVGSKNVFVKRFSDHAASSSPAGSTATSVAVGGAARFCAVVA